VSARAQAAPAPELLERARAGERSALARLITRVERGGDEADEVAALARGPGEAHVVGITGAPGSGKSTLTGRLVALLLEAGRRPAVLAIDPTSPLTGGAILGDRVRMDGVADGAFVRSMATRGHQGGLAAAVPATLRLLDAVGHDPLIVETTGVGQVEVDIASAADTTVLIVAPGWGDAVQANKAGLLEVADVLVVNKADRPGARDARRDLELMLDLGHISGHEERAGGRPRVVMATSTTGEGIDEVAAAVADHRERIAADGRLAGRRRRRRRLEVAGRVERLLEERAAEALDSDAGAAALAAVEEDRLSPAEAARAVLDEVGRSL
jgi:LAO/AO transport system kinase